MVLRSYIEQANSVTFQDSFAKDNVLVGVEQSERILFGFPQSLLVSSLKIDKDTCTTVNHQADILFVKDTLYIQSDTHRVYMKQDGDGVFELGTRALDVEENNIYLRISARKSEWFTPLNCTLTHSLTVGKTISSDSCNVARNITTSSLTLNDDLTCYGDSYVYGEATCKTLNVRQAAQVKGNAIINGDCIVRGAAKLSKNLVVGNDCKILGECYIQNNVSFGGDVLFQGHVLFNGTFEVGQEARINNDMNISGQLTVHEDTRMNNSCFVGNNCSIAGLLSVQSNAKLNGSVIIEKDLTVGSSTTFNNDVIAQNMTVYNTFSAFDLNVDKLVVTDLFEATTDFIVHGVSTLEQVDVHGDLTVENGVACDSLQCERLTCTGTADISSVIATDVSTNTIAVANNLRVRGDATFENGMTVDGSTSCGGDVAVSKDLSVVGIATAHDSLHVLNNATMSSLVIEGDCAVLGGLAADSLTTSELVVTNTAHFATLNVSSNFSFVNLGMASSLAVTSNLNVQGMTTTLGLNVTNDASMLSLMVSDKCTVGNTLLAKNTSIARSQLLVGSPWVESLMDTAVTSLIVNGPCNIDGYLYVNAPVVASSSMTANDVTLSNVVVTGIASAPVFHVSNTLESQVARVDKLDVVGNTTCKVLSCTTMNVEQEINSYHASADAMECGSIIVNNEMNVLGISTFHSFEAANMDVTGAVVCETVTSGNATVETLSANRADIDTLTVQNFTGKATFSGDVVSNASHTVSGKLTAKDAQVDSVDVDVLTVKSSANLEGTTSATSLIVGTDSDIVLKKNVCTILGTQTVSGNVTVNGKATFEGACTIEDASVSSLVITSSANVNGVLTSPIANITTLRADALTVNNSCNVSGNLFVTGKHNVSGDLSVSGVSRFNGDCTFSNGVTVSGRLTSDSVVANSLSVMGNVDIKSNCSASKLIVYNNMDVSDAIVTNMVSTQVSTDKLTIVTSLDAQAVNAKNLNVTDKLTVDGPTTITNNCTITNLSVGGGGATFQGGVTVGGKLVVNGSVQANGTITFGSPSKDAVVSVTGSMSATQVGATTCNVARLNVSDITECKGTLQATNGTFGNATTSTMTCKDANVSGRCVVSGACYVQGNEEIAGNLSVQELDASVIAGDDLIIESNQVTFKVDNVPVVSVNSQGLSLASGKKLTVNGDDVVVKFNQIKQQYDSLNRVCFSGDYNDLVNRPNLAAVALSGSWGDMKNIPAFAAVAYSGDYQDLTGKPNLGEYVTLDSYNSMIADLESTLASITISIDSLASSVMTYVEGG